MDDFVRNAFEEALKTNDLYKEIMDEFVEKSPAMLNVFCKQLSDEDVKDFLDNIMHHPKYGTEVVLLSFVFFATGKIS